MAKPTKHRPPSKTYRPSALEQFERRDGNPICHLVKAAIREVAPLSDEARDFVRAPPPDREWVASMIVWGRAKLLRTTAERLERENRLIHGGSANES